MVNMCMKYIKDILQKLGSSIVCFIFVKKKQWYLPLAGGVIDTTAQIFINNSRNL